MAVFEIPLSAEPQTFNVVLAQVQYRLTVRWRDAADGGWVLDIADATGAALVSGIPLVTGADLLAQYGYLGIGGALTVATDHDTDAVPTFDNLGSLSHLYFTTADG